MSILTQPLAQGHAARPRVGLLATMSNLVAIRRQRRQLRDLDDAMLADLGLTRAQAEAESRRAAWDVPATWRR